MKRAPELRFKEFSGEWEEKRIEEISEVKGGKRLPKGFSLQKEKNETPYITVSDMYTGGVNVKNIKFVPKEAINYIKNYKIYVNELFISVAGSLGIVGKIPEELNGANLTENADKFSDIKISQDYLLEILKSDIIQKQIEKVKTNNAQPKLSLYQIREMIVPVCSLLEQQKIADFLSTIDNKISIKEEKLQNLKNYKKGIMQKIFSQEIRFKDENGGVFPEWEKREIGNIGATYSGLSGKSAIDFGEGQKYITYKTVYNKSKIDLKRVEFVKIGENEKQNKVKYGDIFFTISSETADDIGISSALLSEINENIYLNSFCFGYRLHDLNIYYPEFFRYLFRSNNFRKKILILAQGSTRFNLSKLEMLKFKLRIPCFEEQQKIATLLTSLDDKISNIEKSLEELKIYKKGLLQKMFI